MLHLARIFFVNGIAHAFSGMNRESVKTWAETVRAKVNGSHLYPWTLKVVFLLLVNGWLSRSCASVHVPMLLHSGENDYLRWCLTAATAWLFKKEQGSIKKGIGRVNCVCMLCWLPRDRHRSQIQFERVSDYTKNLYQSESLMPMPRVKKKLQSLKFFVSWIIMYLLLHHVYSQINIREKI